MTRLRRHLLVCEAVVCFGPIASGLLITTLIVVVEGAVALVRGDLPDNRDYWFVVWIAGGIVGLIGVLNVLSWLLYERAFLRRHAAALALMVGAATAVTMMVRTYDGTLPVSMSLIFVLPLAAAAHFAYLARSYLLGRPGAPPRVTAHVAGDSEQGDTRTHERLSARAAVGMTVLACTIMDLFPRLGPPAFRHADPDPGNPVWNLGWPLPLYIYDPGNGIYAGPATGPMLLGQLMLVTLVLIVCLRVRRIGTARIPLDQPIP